MNSNFFCAKVQRILFLLKKMVYPCLFLGQKHIFRGENHYLGVKNLHISKKSSIFARFLETQNT